MKPVDGPLSADDYFAVRPPAPGVRPCRRSALGTARLCTCYQTDQHEKGIETIHTAWRAGFMLVDTAPAYAQAELLLAEALDRWQGERPIISTKTKQNDSRPPIVIEHIRTSQDRLGRIDLLAVHDPKIECPADHRKAISEFVADLLATGQIAAAGIGGGGPAAQGQWLDFGIFKYVITFNRLGAVSLQGLNETVPQAKRHGASVFAASPLFMGLVGNFHDTYIINPPEYIPSAFIPRAQAVKRLADEWGIRMSHLALRFLLSMPMVDVVITGPSSPQEWLDCQTAYEAGPLPAELYAKVWDAAQAGEEPMTGG
jgi:aryl-alcohol dehydrogenase-like predicted oxidoreductase